MCQTLEQEIVKLLTDEVVAAVNVLRERGINGVKYEKLMALQGMSDDQLRNRLAQDRGYTNYSHAHDAIRQEIDAVIERRQLT